MRTDAERKQLNAAAMASQAFRVLDQIDELRRQLGDLDERYRGVEAYHETLAEFGLTERYQREVER